MALRTLDRRIQLFVCIWSALLGLSAQARADGRNCPAVQDAMIVVQPGGPTPVVLPVTNDENGVVTVFQFPLGGQFIHTGPTQLDYAFIPDATFDGRTSVRYRVSPNFDCGGGTLIGVVTLAGGTLPTPSVPRSHACGVGLLQVTALAYAGIMMVWIAQRWRRSARRHDDAARD